MSKMIHNCPSCNMPYEEKEGQENKFCPNCGKLLIFAQVEANTRNPEILLEKACTFINAGNFQAAAPLIDEVLEVSPQYADAYIVKLLCKLQLKNINELGTIDTPLASYEEFQQAVRYASTFQAKRYSKLLESNAQITNQKEQLEGVDKTRNIMQLQKESDALRKEIAAAEAFLYANPIKPPLPRWRRILRTIEQIFMICSVAFWTLGVLAVPQLIIIDAPFVVRLIFIVLRNRKEKRLPDKIQKVTQSLQANRALLYEKTKQLSELANAPT